MKAILIAIVLAFTAMPVAASDWSIGVNVPICDRDEDGNIDKVGLGCVYEYLCEEVYNGDYAADYDHFAKTGHYQLWGCWNGEYCSTHPNLPGCRPTTRPSG